MPQPHEPSIRRDWEDLASLDPLWAILSDEEKQYDGWSLQEFFETGESEISALMKMCAELGYPKQRERALDFGCGIGRLTRALRNHFYSCTGVDISPTMIAQARELNPGCLFEVLGKQQLQIFPDQHFDFIYSNIVLQHQPAVTLVRTYIREFLRTLTPTGLLVFQLPHSIPFRYRLQPRRRAYHALRALGFKPETLYRNLRLNPISMLAVPEAEVRKLIEPGRGRVLRVLCDHNGGPHIQSRTYFVTRT